jgi:hypothetical protein
MYSFIRKVYNNIWPLALSLARAASSYYTMAPEDNKAVKSDTSVRWRLLKSKRE